MIATYKGGGTELTFSADTMFDSTSAAAAGSAQRLGDVAPVTLERTVPEEDIEEAINNIERKREDPRTPTGVWYLAVVLHARGDGEDHLEEHQS